MNKFFLDLPEILEGDRKGKNKIEIPNQKTRSKKIVMVDVTRKYVCEILILSLIRMKLNKLNL